MFTANKRTFKESELGYEPVGASLSGSPIGPPTGVPTEGHPYRFLSRPFKYCVRPRLFNVAAMFSLVWLVACETNRVEPVALAPEDMCAYCKMAISEKRYAAELIGSEGAVFKFDDIGCMANFIKGQKNAVQVGAFYVMDFDDGQWIKADNAYYVRSSKLATPMNGGIIAFKNQSQAEQAISKYSGKLLSFKDIFNL